VAVEIEVNGTADPAIRRAAHAAVDAAGVGDGHVAIAFVGEDEMRRLNREHRGRDEPTDVLSFPVDGPGRTAGPRELGDVVVCAARAHDSVEAVVHGVLHLCGLDHETDAGEMLALQDRVMGALR
jgi:probable rRNA maturation factor